MLGVHPSNSWGRRTNICVGVHPAMLQDRFTTPWEETFADIVVIELFHPHAPRRQGTVRFLQFGADAATTRNIQSRLHS